MMMGPDSISVQLGADAKFTAAERLTHLYDTILRSRAEDITLDGSKVYWVSPFTACWLAAVTDQTKLLGKSINVVEPVRENAVHQWDNLGISRYLGLSKRVKKMSNLPSFPVRRLTEPSYPLAGRVTEILTQRLRGAENFHKALHFSIRETIENAFEHGETDHCYVCAYSVPTKNVVRLCILDTGIGIPNSMRTNPEYVHLERDEEAIKMSTRYGASSKAADRGIGLYILSDVAQKNEGVLSILSGQGLVNVSRDNGMDHLDKGFPGTALKLTLKTRREFHYINVASWEAL